MSREREIDALVAEHVMGWDACGDTDCLGCDAPVWKDALGQWHVYRAWEPWKPSEKIGPAWEVVEKMRAEGWWFWLVQDNTDIWDAKLWRGEPKGRAPRDARSHERRLLHTRVTRQDLHFARP